MQIDQSQSGKGSFIDENQKTMEAVRTKSTANPGDLKSFTWELTVLGKLPGKEVGKFQEKRMTLHLGKG